MKTRWLAVAALLLSAAPALARPPDGKDPEAALKEILAWRAETIKLAQEKKEQLNFADIQKEQISRAKAAVLGVDPAKQQPEKSMAWAQLFELAQMPAESVAAAGRFLTGNPAAPQRFAAQNMVLSGLQELGDGARIESLLKGIQPPTARDAAILASRTAQIYAPVISAKRGLEAGLNAITRAESLVKPDQLTSEKDKQLLESVQYSVAMGRNALLDRAGKKAEALAALEEGRKKLPAESRFGKAIDARLRLARLPGMVAPEIVAEKVQGQYASVASYRGKVLLIDFTAHW